MCGAKSFEELEACLAYVDAPPTARDFAAALAAFPRISWRGHCMYCGHCAPCPVHIDVAMVTKLLHLAKAQGATPETVREHYGLLKASASACVQCGACEGRCPFAVPVRENMAEAARIFGK
jgi:predicted aldo/keto reductase-like oxidoreductase